MTIFRTTLATLLFAGTALPAMAESHGMETPITYGPRPFYLINTMEDGDLKDKLASCTGQAPAKSDWSVGHRGAAMLFPDSNRSTKSPTFATDQPRSLLAKSPNMSMKMAWVRVSSLASAWRRLARSASAASKIAAIRRCSSIGGNLRKLALTIRSLTAG